MNDIRQDLITDEGYSNTVYLDSMQNLTVGIGHKVLDSDKLSLGDTISDEQVEKFFIHDLSVAINDIEQLLTKDIYSTLNGDMKRALINMSFNLGFSRLSGFRHMITYIKTGDYYRAAEEILNSKAARQLPKRYNRIHKLFIKGVVSNEKSYQQYTTDGYK